jgi:alpha-galactosidase
MSFGLWVEPEMVNPDSALYRAHPDWVIHFPGRPRTEQRNQLVLNLAKPEVRRFVFEMLDRLVSENEIAFLKWDHNRYWSEPGWPDHGAAGQQALYVEYVRNLYAILDELRQRHPALEVEDCAGGGGRTDLGMLGRTDEVWTSDNTDPFDRLAIQDGFSQAYPPLAMVAWVTDSPNWVNGRSTTLDYRFLSSMQGALGIGANLDKWSAADMATASQFIAAYKSVRATVQLGELYRLESPQGRAPRSATLSVTRDRRHAALFVFLHSAVLRAPQPAVHLRGLDPQLRYAVRSLDGKPLPEGLPAAASGAYWMDAGVRLQLEGDHAARGLAFEVTP